jgi:hypothetical protein
LQTRTFRFAWTPKEKGQFRIDAGVFGRVGVPDLSSSGMALLPCACREPALKPDSTALLTKEIAALLTRQQRPGHHAGSEQRV